jgi:glyoxylase-like metal-dependent hydrolase (beta-lactamase superfamily II)
MLLQQISERTYYIPGANNLGVIATPDRGAIAVDTGIDKDTGRLIRKALDQAGLQLRAIIATHHHADHIGGNDFLMRNIPGVELLAPPLEAALVEHPLLEPVYLSMGARPVPALQTKWLMAKGAPVSRLIHGPMAEVAGVALEVLQLPGHSLGQIGVVCDGVAFVADGFFGPAVLAKHGIPYAQDIAGQIASLDMIAGCAAEQLLPGHGDLTARAALGEVLDANRAAIGRTADAVLQALGDPAELSEVGRRVQRALGLHFGGPPQYVIFLSGISAHLAHLESQGLARVDLMEHGLIWSRA